MQLRLGAWPHQHSATNETVSPVRNVIVEVMLQPLSMASRHFIVAVGCIPGSLLASFPTLAQVIRIGFEKALRLQHLQPAVDFNPIMTRAAVEPPAGASIHAASDVGDGRAKLIRVERHSGKRDPGQGNCDDYGGCAHTAPPICTSARCEPSASSTHHHRALITVKVVDNEKQSVRFGLP